MAWRTNEFVTPAPVVTVAVPPGRAESVDLISATQHLSQAIKFQTITDPSGTPRDPAEFLNFRNWILATYPTLAAATRIEQVGDHSLLFTWAGSDKAAQPIILVGHLDVAAADPAARAAWKVDPYSGAIKDGVVWGRGTQIGKANLVSMLEASERLAKAGFKPRRTILFAFGHDGDARGEQGAAQIARVLASRKIKAWFALDEGPPIISRHSMTGKPAALIGVTEKADLDLQVIASGTGGTAAVRGQQAITSVSQAVVALGQMPNGVPLTEEPSASMFKALAKDMPYDRAFVLANSWALEPIVHMQIQNVPGAEDLLSTTVQVTRIAAGATQTLRPASADATLNVRLHPRDPPAQFLARARAVISPYPDVRLEWATKPGPRIPISSHTSSAYRLIEALARNASDGATVVPALYSGSTDARHYTSVAQDVYRFTPALWTPQDVRTVMNPNEHLSRENLRRMIMFYEQLMAESAK
jgi:carboxypeptidase PM20D1